MFRLGVPNISTRYIRTLPEELIRHLEELSRGPGMLAEPWVDSGSSRHSGRSTQDSRLILDSGALATTFHAPISWR